MAKDDLVQVSVVNAEETVERMLGTLGIVGSEAPTVVLRALNKTATGMKTDIKRLIREEYNVPARDLEDRIWVNKATRKNLQARVRAFGKMSIPLIRYGARPNKPGGKRPAVGVSVLVKKTSGRKVVPLSFVGTAPDGSEQMYMRVGDDRLPVRRLFGPPHLAPLSTPEARQRLGEEAHERFQKNMEHEASFLLSKAGLR